MLRVLSWTLIGLLACSVIAAAQEPEAAEDKWAEHRGELPFVLGYEHGMQQVKLSGQPPMYFFTATW